MSAKIFGLLHYNCIKCTTEVNLEVRPNMTSKTLELWESMFDGKLCLKCYTNSKIPQTAEAIRGFLCH